MSTNFQIFDPNKVNIMDDAAYLASEYRENGARPGIAPSETHNKLFYQTSIFNAAFAQSLSNRGLTVSDAVFADLVAVFDQLLLTSQSRNWKASQAYTVGEICYPSGLADSYKRLECTTAGTSGTTEPSWGIVGATVSDGTVIWTVRNVNQAAGSELGSLFALKQGANIASSSTTALSGATGNFVLITGTTTINSFGTVSAGIKLTLKFQSALTITHNATSMITLGNASISVKAGDICEVLSLGGGNWLVEYVPMTNIDANSQKIINVANAVSASDAVNLGQFLGVTSTSGYFMLPQGIMFQWFETGPGTVPPGGGTASVLSWPYAFPSACLFAGGAVNAANFTESTAAFSIFYKSRTQIGSCASTFGTAYQTNVTGYLWGIGY